MTKPESPRRHPNVAEKRALKAAQMADFLKAVGRKAQKGCEPNDRRYNTHFQQKLRRMSAVDVDRLMRDDDEDDASAGPAA